VDLEKRASGNEEGNAEDLDKEMTIAGKHLCPLGPQPDYRSGEVHFHLDSRSLLAVENDHAISLCSSAQGDSRYLRGRFEVDPWPEVS
jgi:hypothetical protein